MDRSRPIYGKDVWPDEETFTDLVPDSFNLDYWSDSATRPQIWTEKDALSQIMLSIANEYNVQVFVTRGFLSVSNKMRWGGSEVSILYFGDFDPSGLFIDKDLRVDVLFQNFERVALTRVMASKLPSIPIKRKDPRSPAYVREYGVEAWELDALDPNKLRDLVRESIEKYMNFDLEQKRDLEAEIRGSIKHKLTRKG